MELAANSSLSEFTKNTLAQFDWKDGDPIPAELGQLLISFKDGLPPSKNVYVLVDATLLDEAKLKQVNELLAAAKVFAKEKDRREQLMKPIENAKIDPGTKALYEKLMLEKTEVIDDRPPAEKKPAPAAVEEEKEPAPETTPSEAEAEKPAPVPEVPAPVLVGEPFCPRCGWDMKQKFEVIPSDQDKEDFLIATLGGQRFRKKYELFGGRVVVTFRSMLAEENKAVYRQLTLDQTAKKIATEAEWFVQMMDYRLACSLEEVAEKGGKIAAEIPELQLVSPLPADDAANPLVAQLKIVNSGVLGQEVTRRLVGAHLRRFQRLLEALEAMALEPSFWQGIE